MICYKHDAMMFGSGIVEVERGGFAEAKPYAWQTDTAVASNSWCYTDSLDYEQQGNLMYPRGCGKQERPSALEYRTQSGWYNSPRATGRSFWIWRRG